MNRILLTLTAFILPLLATAGSGDAVFNKVVDTYKSSGGISVAYSVSAPEGKYAGTIIMQGNKFRILSADIICWFDGKTQWSYSTISEEVNIMQPTADELQAVNPFSIISNFRTSYNATLLKSGTTAAELKLLPKDARKSDIQSVLLSVNKKTNLPEKIIFTLKDKSRMTVTLSKYATGMNYPASAFVLDKKMVPAGTPIVDLR